MATTIRSLRRRWSVKHSISAAMLVALVIIVVAAAISITLAPAHLSFYVKEANIAIITNNSIAYNTHLNFTLVANNSSPRTAARYGFMSAEVWYGPAATAWVRTVVNMTDASAAPTVWQPPESEVQFYVSVDYGYLPGVGSDATHDSRVVVESKVWFMYGLATTLPFNVRFTCCHVDFVDNSSFPVICAPTILSCNNFSDSS